MPTVSQTYLEALFSSEDKKTLVEFLNHYIDKELNFQFLRDTLMKLTTTESKFLPTKESVVANAIGNLFSICSSNYSVDLHPSFEVRRNQQESLRKLFVDINTFSENPESVPLLMAVEQVFKRHNAFFERVFTIPSDSSELYADDNNYEDTLNLLRARPQNPTA